jgi:hypothetical protein
MARIFTPPDIEYDRSIPKILIRNCDWSDDLITQILSSLSDKNYDIYIYHDKMNDVQWAEGIRSQARRVFDCRQYNEDPAMWLKRFDDEFTA